MTNPRKKTDHDESARMHLSSAQTDPSKIYERVSALGRRIVSELDRESQRDTLTRWMAYRVAELMQLAESTDPVTAAKGKVEAATLILRVWERRRKWPHGDPLEQVDSILTLLAESQHEYPQRVELNRQSLMEARERLTAISRNESAFLLQAEVAGFDYEYHRSYLSDHGDQLEEREREVLSWIVQRIETIRGRALAGDDESVNLTGSIEEREKAIKQKLALFASQRQTAYDSLRLVDSTDSGEAGFADDDPAGVQ